MGSSSAKIINNDVVVSYDFCKVYVERSSSDVVPITIFRGNVRDPIANAYVINGDIYHQLFFERINGSSTLYHVTVINKVVVGVSTMPSSFSDVLEGSLDGIYRIGSHYVKMSPINTLISGEEYHVSFFYDCNDVMIAYSLIDKHGNELL